MPPTSKLCYKCQVERPFTDFYLRRETGLPVNECKPCQKVRKDAYYRTHRDRLLAKGRKQWDEVKGQARIANLKRKYALSENDYQALLEKQAHLCAICKRSEKVVRKGRLCKTLAVDHDHRTDQVRGLLCGPCNRGLGHFKDDPVALVRAALYLQGTLT